MSLPVPAVPLEPSDLMVLVAQEGRKKRVRLLLGDVVVEMAPQQAEDLSRTLAAMAALAWAQ